MNNINISDKCFKCGSTNHIIKHHLSYIPEMIVDCCRKCHRAIHIKVRKENACKYSVEEVKKMSMRSSAKRSTQTIDFYETLSPYVQLYENIHYNKNTGNVYYVSGFSGAKSRKIWAEDI